MNRGQGTGVRRNQLSDARCQLSVNSKFKIQNSKFCVVVAAGYWLWAVVFLSPFASCLTPSLYAHTFPEKRVLTLGIESNQLVLEAFFAINPGEEAKQIKKLFDADADGVLADQELERFKSYLGKLCLQGIQAFVNGEDAKLMLEETQILNPQNSLASEALSKTRFSISLSGASLYFLEFRLLPSASQERVLFGVKGLESSESSASLPAQAGSLSSPAYELSVFPDEPVLLDAETPLVIQVRQK